MRISAQKYMRRELMREWEAYCRDHGSKELNPVWFSFEEWLEDQQLLEDE